MESFYIGVCIGFCARILTLKALRWPMTSLPLRSIPPIIMSGIIFSAVDMMRRASLEEMLLRQERSQVNKQLRQDDKHYDL